MDILPSSGGPSSAARQTARAPLESNRIELLNSSNSMVESNFYIGKIRP